MVNYISPRTDCSPEVLRLYSRALGNECYTATDTDEQKGKEWQVPFALPTPKNDFVLQYGNSPTSVKGFYLVTRAAIRPHGNLETLS